MGLDGVLRPRHRHGMQQPANSPRRDLFVDQRGGALRVTWHPERDQVVVSLWRADVCVGTVRLSRADTGRLAAFLTTSLGNTSNTGVAVS